MRYATAVSKLVAAAGALARDAETARDLADEGPRILAAYAFGPLLDGADPVDAADVAFVVDRPASQLPWGTEPREVRAFLALHRLDRAPLRWSCRPLDAPVGNHRIRRPVRFWSAEDGTDEAVLDALAQRRLDALPRLPEADAGELDRQLEEEAAVCLAALEELVHGGPVDPPVVADELFDLAWGYTDLRRGQRELRDGPTTATASPDTGSGTTAPAWDPEGYARLRGAVRRGDGRATLEALHELPLEEVAQLAGDAALVALAQGVTGADDLARRCVETLRARGWEGDDDLADDLAAAVGQAPTPARRAVPVDLDELASALESGGLYEGGMRLELATGRLWPAPDALGWDSDEVFDDGWDDPDAWLGVEPLGSRDAYRDMELFTATLTDRRLADRLERAIEGRGAFRRFRGALESRPEEQGRWRVLSSERSRGRARSWLAAHGYRPVPPVE